jgi:DNA-binding MarR family transcriptional regulator
MADNPFDHSGIDDVIHGRIRLGTVAYLSTVQSALFPELRDKMGTTDGNLSTHLRKLEDAGYVSVEKSFANRKPRTRVALTATGRKAWLDWLERMRGLAAAANPENEG